MTVLQEGYRLSLLRAVNMFIRDTGQRPVIRDLKAITFASSTSVVGYNLEQLRRAGLLTWDRGKARTIRLTAAGRMELGLPTEEEEEAEWEAIEAAGGFMAFPRRETRDERYPDTTWIGEVGAASAIAPVVGIDPLVARRRGEREAS